MAMLITTIANIKEQSSEAGFKMFCEEQGIDPENYAEPEEGVCVDKMALYRYGAAIAAKELTASVKSFKKSSGMNP